MSPDDCACHCLLVSVGSAKVVRYPRLGGIRLGLSEAWLPRSGGDQGRRLTRRAATTASRREWLSSLRMALRR
jgi:hypothetical protein